MNGKDLMLVWDAYAPERFWLASNGIYYPIHKEAKVFTLKHTLWTDDVSIHQGRLCRLSNKDCADVIRQNRNVITIQWDKFGKERFKRNSKTNVFEHQL
jgi:hypothetical protein